MPRRKKGSSENSRLSSSSMSINKDKPQQRNAANARERARMRVLSRAFCRLKTTLPWVPADTKLSKLDTLRLASSYIGHLKGILRDDSGCLEDPVHPAMSLTWPFGFNRSGGGNGSVGGGSGSEGESVSSCAWEEVAKDCVHLEEQDIPVDPPHNSDSSSFSSSSHCNPSNNTSILSSNNSSPLFHLHHHHHSNIPSCFHDNHLLSIG